MEIGLLIINVIVSVCIGGLLITLGVQILNDYLAIRDGKLVDHRYYWLVDLNFLTGSFSASINKCTLIFYIIDWILYIGFLVMLFVL